MLHCKRKNKNMVQKQKAERKELKVGHCVSGLQKKEKRRKQRTRRGEKGKTESSRGRRPAHYSPDANVWR